jgi:hypothetical protein
MKTFLVHSHSFSRHSGEGRNPVLRYVTKELRRQDAVANSSQGTPQESRVIQPSMTLQKKLDPGFRRDDGFLNHIRLA